MGGESGDAETGKLTWSGKSDESGGDRWGRGADEKSQEVDSNLSNLSFHLIM